MASDTGTGAGNDPDLPVVTVQHDGWQEIVLNRPAVRNAIDGPLGEHLAAAISAANASSDTRVVLLRGAGGAFCSGLDLKAFNAQPAPEWLPRFASIWRAAHRALFECRKPIVTALERYAINGGAALALAGDLLVAGETAFVQIGEVRQGMAAPYNVAWLRLRHSEALTARLVLTGRRFPGPELEALGIASATAPDDAVVSSAATLAEELAGYPPDALVRIKTTLRAYGPQNADAWFDLATGADPLAPRLAPRPVS